MDHVETLATFASKFVVPSFRKRFIHEALKKPRKLQQRICHGIDQVLKPGFLNGRCSFHSSDPCLVLGWNDQIELRTWGEATQHLGMGGGLLIIDVSGTRFLAETEAEPGSPARIYAG